MSDDRFTAPHPSSKWSIQDVIAHLMAWQEISSARLEAALLNAEPELPGWLGGADPFYAEDHSDDFNARIYAMYRDRAWSDIYRGWREGFLRFLELAEAIPESILGDTERYSWLKGYALSAVLEGSCEHHREHLEDWAAPPQ